MAKETYPNQFVIYRGEEMPKDAEHPYVKVSSDAFYKAAKDFNKNSFEMRLWLHLHFLRPGKENGWGFSPKYLIEQMGGTEKSWREAREGLKEKGYLRATGSSSFEFVEDPKYENETKTPQTQWDF